MSLVFRLLIVCVIVLSSAPCGLAQRGDRGNTKMPEVWKDMDVPPAPVVSPEDSLKAMKVAPGFRVELVAAEPLVEDPVAMAWDGDGNLYVVEMRGYMPNVDGKGETDLTNGVVAVLQDTTNDGRMDKRTEFLSGLVMPRAVSIVQGGVLVAEPPNLWYCQDTNADFICDKKTKVATYARQGPVEHTDNALMPALDNWIYNAKSSRRFKFRDGAIVEEKTRGRGQWGITQDNYGRLFYTSNSRYWMGDWDTYLNAGMKSIGGYLGGTGTDIHSVRVNPGINRGYQSNMLKKDGRLARVTAVSGLAIYRGGQYPAPYNHAAFIAEPAANAVACFSMKEKDNKLQLTHQLYEDPKWGQREFLASTDERFRPVSIYNGPDGCIYVVDMYRGILQHKVYVTTFLRKQILERELDKPLGLGRIYRIVPEGKIIQHRSPGLKRAPGPVLAQNLSHKNGWVRDAAQRLLVQQKEKAAIPSVESILKHPDHLARIHALWTLHGMEALTREHCLSAMNDDHPRVRMTGLVVSEQWVRPPASEVADFVTTYKRLQKDSDTLVSSLAQHMQKVAAGEDKEEQKVVKKRKLKGEHKKLFEKGKEVYGMTCFGCHQTHGKGLENVAPPLDGSDWIKGGTDRLIKIALDGMTGPITVNGKTYENYPVMPGHRPALNDQQIAAVLTYVRGAWSNEQGMVKPSDVAKLREKTKGRELPYTEAELKKK